MAESFSNSVKRAVGIISATSSGAIGITTNKITGLALDTGLVSIGDLVINADGHTGAGIINIDDIGDANVAAAAGTVNVGNSNTADLNLTGDIYRGLLLPILLSGLKVFLLALSDGHKCILD